MKVFNKIIWLTFDDIMDWDRIFLYAGDIPEQKEYDIDGIVGLSIKAANKRTIRHNICMPYPLPDNSVDAYQAEDVLEHIEYDILPDAINEIYRVLKKGAYFRLSVPDYGCDLLRDRSVKDENGNIIFDAGGGRRSRYKNGKVTGGGHVWFPTYEKVKALIEKTNFKEYEFYHYYDENGNSVTKKIDYTKGYVKRTPDHDARVQDPYRAMSIVVDLFK